MTALDRWRCVEGLFHAALARDEDTRAAFLREACGGDEALKDEIESLLVYEPDAQAFMAAPVLESLPTALPRVGRMTPGRCFGPYEIVSFLGAGGMGDVYRARDTKLGRDVAVKILPDVFQEHPQHRARLEREARLLASLSHPHIAAIHGFEDRDGLYGLILELVEGETLAARIREGPLSIREALTIAGQVADALQAAHAKGVVHRDLKPANIALTRERTAKVLDFGLAKSVVEEWDGAAAPAMSIVDSGAHVIIGTAAYMSPEQARGQPVDNRADIWAFGTVLWAMLTGHPPFSGDTVSETISAILDREPDWNRLPPTLPAGIARLLHHCLEKDAARRLRDIGEARITVDQALERAAAAGQPGETGRRRRRTVIATISVAGVVSVGAVVSSLVLPRSTTRSGNDIAFAQLTNFTDSAVAPAISPDGRMVAFIRGDRPFLTTDPIYLKRLPDGEAIQVTDDPRSKYGIAFSPDGSHIAYTALTREGANTYVLPVLGGEPQPLLTNASGLTWLDRDRFLFSEIRTGFHMGIVTAGENRSNHRELYFPTHERSMAHYAYASPDRRWALVVEMDHRPVWEPCRLISLDGTSPVRSVGPIGRCSSAGWSRDGRWMYFSVDVNQESHLWRQRFPNGAPEQLTFGPSQEDGIAVAPDGSLITSIGQERSAIWIRDSRGERPLSSEGDIIARLGSHSLPSFSPDGHRLFYLRRGSAGSTPELWRTDIASGKSEPLLPGVAMVEYDISRDGSRVVFTAQPTGRPSELWVAWLDRSSPPQRVASSGENSPHWGPDGEILFRFTDGKVNHLGRMNPDGSLRGTVVEYPIGTIQTISTDRQWLVALIPRAGAGRVASMAVPTRGGDPRLICAIPCYSRWSPDGKFLYVQLEARSRTSAGTMIVMPVSRETGLPDLPEGGIQSAAQASAIRGSWIVDYTNVVPGLDHETYAYVKTSALRNLFRITVP